MVMGVPIFKYIRIFLFNYKYCILSVADPSDFLIRFTDFLYAVKCETVCIFPITFLIQNAFTCGNMQSFGLNSCCLMLLTVKAHLAC